jgi:uncharacterized protein
MTNFIPVFPLQIVAYPTEQVNLHIFEPRYKQLIKECYTQNNFFCIPIIIDGYVQEFATVLQVISIEKQYKSGEMDIHCNTLYTCKILEIIKEVPNKMYSGAIVMHLPIPTFTASHLQAKVLDAVAQLHQILQIQKKYKKPFDTLTSFDVAHHVGLTIQQEYQLLCIESETQRWQYLDSHLQHYISTLSNRQATIDRIYLNGQFRNLSAEDFDFKIKK